jgi:hypothetical protein
MRQIFALIFAFLTTIAPAVAAETTERNESVPDANPACMDINGPDCVLRSQVVPPRTAAPQGVIVAPAPAPPIVPAPGTSTVIAPVPPAQHSTIISPRP